MELKAYQTDGFSVSYAVAIQKVDTHLLANSIQNKVTLFFIVYFVYENRLFRLD